MSKVKEAVKKEITREGFPRRAFAIVGDPQEVIMDIGEIFRKATRPVVTIIFASTIAQVVVDKIDAPEWFIGLAIPVILWWFGERTVTHIKNKKGGTHAQT